jgi:hypothetical protein
MSFPEFVIAGVPLVFVIFGLVEFAKVFGLTGKILTALSALLGVAFAVAFQLATAVPSDAMGWLTVIVVGLIYGLTTSGVYDFVNARFPAKA